MSQATAEMILAEIAALPAEEREKLQTLLDRQSSAVNGQAAANDFIQPFDKTDPAPSLRWLAEHRAEFAGQYVALDGERLLAHGTEPQPVIEAVRASGLNGLFFTYLQPLDEPPFAGF